MTKNKKGFFMLSAMVALTLSVALSSCGGKKGNRTGVDEFGVFPESVMKYSGDIDCLVYIEGQHGELKDIGNPNYTKDELNDSALARFAAAAREYKKIAPNTKINVIWTTIAEFNDRIISYRAEHGHVPHIMHATDHVNEMMQAGFAADISVYKDFELYKAYDDSILAEFNWGGFQAAVPYMIYPMGVFANTKLLSDKYVDYSELLKDYTFEKFVEICERVVDFDHSIAAMPHVQQDFVSYAVPSVNQSYKFNREVKLNTDTISRMLDLEARLSATTGYVYGQTTNGGVRTGMTDIAPWQGNRDFIESDKFVFNAEMPWNLGLLSLLATKVGREADFDYLPWPAADDETGSMVGMIAEGLTVGNQCPLVNGKESCVSGGKEAQEAAAFFAMFLTADPRSIEARRTIKWVSPSGEGYEDMSGMLDLPMVEKNFKFSFENEDVEAPFYRQLRYWLECYSTWWNKTSDDDVPDVYDYDNIKPGFKQVLELFYGADQTRRINYYGIPDNLPNTQGGTTDVMEKWTGRYNTNSVKVTAANWSSVVKSQLSTIENEINQRIEDVWSYFQENVDSFYGVGKYVLV